MKGSLGRFALDEVYLGDAHDLLQEIPPATIDLIVTDPPFGIRFRAQRENYNRTGARVLGGYREVAAQDYGAFTRRWVQEAARVLDPRGSMYVISGWNGLKDVLMALDAAGLTTVNHLIWKYQFGVFTRKKYVTSHYHILFAVRNPRNYTFNKIHHYPEDVWEIPREYWTGRIKTPTKLPEALVERILLYSSNPGDTVLDPFIGSGTVAAVSKRLGRRFLGFEIVPEYHAFAQDRIRDTVMPPDPEEKNQER
jgi:site-specific DNA-methyltransferase (adenine-specific)